MARSGWSCFIAFWIFPWTPYKCCRSVLVHVLSSSLNQSPQTTIPQPPTTTTVTTHKGKDPAPVIHKRSNIGLPPHTHTNPHPHPQSGEGSVAADRLSAHRVKPLRSPYGLQSPPLPFFCALPLTRPVWQGMMPKVSRTINRQTKSWTLPSMAPGQLSWIDTAKHWLSSHGSLSDREHRFIFITA